MMGRVNEVVNETSKGWTKFFQKNPDFLTSQEEFAKATSPTISDKSKGKGILGSSTPILTQSQLAITKGTQLQLTIIESVQDTRNTVDNTPPIVTNTAPSGKATDAKEVEMDKVKPTKSIPVGKTNSPTKVLAIDTSEVEKKSVSKLSPTKLMMMTT